MPLRPRCLIEPLAAGLRPVRRLPARGGALRRGSAPWWVVPGCRAVHRFRRRCCTGCGDAGHVPGFAGALLTAVLAALAAFITSVPGRTAWWAVLPLPPLVLWLGASTAGCLRRGDRRTRPETPMHPMVCIYFIVLVSVPLSSLLMRQILRACPLRPALTASPGGAGERRGGGDDAGADPSVRCHVYRPAGASGGGSDARVP